MGQGLLGGRRPTFLGTAIGGPALATREARVPVAGPTVPLRVLPESRTAIQHEMRVGEPNMSASAPLVSILMGSKSDWETMQATHQTLDQYGVSHESRVLSAHRTPAEAAAYVREAEARGTEIFIAAAGGAAHLAGAVAAHTVLPVLGVPMKGWSLDGLDSLLSTVQMPRGIPVGTLAIGKAGAVNAALLAVSILSLSRPELREKLKTERRREAERILAEKLQ